MVAFYANPSRAVPFMTYIEPLLLIFIGISLAGLVAIRGRRGRCLAWAGVLGLLLISWPPVDWLLAQPLEWRYPDRPFVAPAGVQAVVVLGSSIRHPQKYRPYPLPDYETIKRCKHAAWIAKRTGLPVLACQGTQLGVSPQAGMLDVLKDEGVPESMIWIEARSGSTFYNAVFGGEVLRAHGVKRIVLVVDGQSMLRAAGCFRREGFDVTPAPSELRTWGPLIEEVFPSWKSIQRNEVTLHEALGLLWYRLRGWI